MLENDLPVNVIQPSPNSLEARYPHPAKQRGRGLFGLFCRSRFGIKKEKNTAKKPPLFEGVSAERWGECVRVRFFC